MIGDVIGAIMGAMIGAIMGAMIGAIMGAMIGAITGCYDWCKILKCADCYTVGCLSYSYVYLTYRQTYIQTVFAPIFYILPFAAFLLPTMYHSINLLTIL